MNPVLRQALISDLFFNYQNENYAKLDWEKGPADEEVDAALEKDAVIFASQYFELLMGPGLSWTTEDEFAQWLVKDFIART